MKEKNKIKERLIKKEKNKAFVCRQKCLKSRENSYRLEEIKKNPLGNTDVSFVPCKRPKIHLPLL